jgi:ADP-heptose:LPS heptosyltransferase
MASILFLAPADLGEVVLATGAVAHALGEGGALTVVCAPEAAPLFRAAPGLETLHALESEAGLAARWRVWMQLARQRFDLIIDGRGGFLGRALPAGRRIALRPAAQVRHLTEDWAEAAGADRPLAPTLWLDDAARAAAVKAVPQDCALLLLLAPGGASTAKRWPWERFAAVARRLASGPMSGACVVSLGAAARDADITRAVVNSLDADGVRALDLNAELDLLAAAALAERATLVLGNDNALTQVAAAADAPTLTLFGPTDERVRAPWGPRARTLRGRTFQEFLGLPELDARAAMEDVGIDAVEAAALDLLRAGGLR